MQSDPQVETLRDLAATSARAADTERLYGVIRYTETHPLCPEAADVFFQLADAAGDELMGRLTKLPTEAAQP